MGVYKVVSVNGLLSLSNKFSPVPLASLMVLNGLIALTCPSAKVKLLVPLWPANREPHDTHVADPELGEIVVPDGPRQVVLWRGG